MAVKTYTDPVTGQIVRENVPDVQMPANPTATEQIAPTPIKREGGGIATLNHNNELLEIAREIIRKKQGNNKDLTESSAYWQEVYGDTNAFGSPRGAEAKPGLTGPKDINYRQLPPDQQASIRLSRQNAALANLRTNAEERKFRADASDSTIKALSDALAVEDKAGTDALTLQGKIYDVAEKKRNAGFRLTADDFYLDATEGIGEKIGGTDAWRHSTPTLLPLNDITKKYGGVAGITLSDGTVMAAFSDEEDGEKAMKALFTQDKYKNYSLDDALKDITGGKYDSTILPNGGISKRASEVTEDEWGQIIDGIKSKEWDDTGRNLNDIGGELPEGWTENQLKELSKASGVDYAKLRGMDTQTLIDLSVENAANLAKAAVETFNARELVNAKVDKDGAEIIVSAIIMGITGDPANSIPPDKDFVDDLIAAGIAKDEVDAGVKIVAVGKLINKEYGGWWTPPTK